MGPASLITTAVVACGALAGAGIAIAVAGVVPAAPPAAARRWRPAPGQIDQALLRAAAAVGCGVLVGGLTRWPVAAVAATVLAGCGPALFGGERRSRAQMQRREALASWTEMLRDTLEAGRGLETAIAASAAAAPLPIRLEVQQLAAELRTASCLDAALRRFAARIDDASCDRVVAGLLLRRQDQTLGAVLTAIAVQTREDVAVARRNEVEQARARWSARTIIGITAGLAGGLAILDRRYLEPYDSAIGQVFLAIVVATAGAAFWWLGRLAQAAPAPRLLVSDTGEDPGW